MKHILILVSLVPTLALAHGQSPQIIERNVLTPISEVSVTVYNGYESKKCYLIEVNGNITPQRICLNGRGKHTVKTHIRNIKDKVSENEICSILERKQKEGMGTRMCTRVRTYYPFSYLQ